MLVTPEYAVAVRFAGTDFRLMSEEEACGFVRVGEVCVVGYVEVI